MIFKKFEEGKDMAENLEALLDVSHAIGNHILRRVVFTLAIYLFIKPEL